MSETRWMDVTATAAYLSVRPDALQRLVRQGRIPKPDYSLGPRSPRWSRAALDSVFEGGTASTNPTTAVTALAEKIEAEGLARRSA